MHVHAKLRCNKINQSRMLLTPPRQQSPPPPPPRKCSITRKRSREENNVSVAVKITNIAMSEIVKKI